MINASDLDSDETTADETSGTETKGKSPVPPPRVRRLGKPEFTEPGLGSSNSRPSPMKARPKKIKESPYPVFWVEAFNEARQKWIPFDPIVTHTLEKPSKFEPPSADPENNLSYVIAFEEDGSAIDVTRRYSKFYNAKTRKNRVESTKDGGGWWRKTMNFYRKAFHEDRDQIEASELAAKEAREPMPRNVMDFKDHPFYALERHLRRNEVIHPRRVVGKVGAGKTSVGKDEKLEDIFRRQDVHVVRSAEGWYRLGREIKDGEQPVKHAAPRRNKEIVEDEDGMAEEDASVGLYAAFQTDIYKPPPVVNGRVPKNVYGNLDVYTPSMVPEGGFYLQDPRSVRAAKLLGIDYAEAVVGFEFKGRQGHAVFQGVVVVDGYREALLEVLNGFDDEEAQAMDDRRTLQALAMWKRLLLRLRIKEKVEEHGGEMGQEGGIEDKVDDEEEGGGFFPDADEGVAEPTAGRPGHFGVADVDDEGGGFLPNELDERPMETSPVKRAAEWTGTSPGLNFHEPKANPRPSPHKEKPTRYILHIRSLDEPDPYAIPPSLPSSPTVPQPNPPSPLQPGNPPKVPPKAATPSPTVLDAPGPSPALPDNAPPSAEADSSAQRSPPPQKEQTPVKDVKIQESDSESELEKSSLLSHDPEDEDADPEWIEDF
jgi:xeroderma pigmentosum group C-complementing protein